MAGELANFAASREDGRQSTLLQMRGDVLLQMQATARRRAGGGDSRQLHLNGFAFGRVKVFRRMRVRQGMTFAAIHEQGHQGDHDDESNPATGSDHATISVDELLELLAADDCDEAHPDTD